jgi:hypothetical protein
MPIQYGRGKRREESDQPGRLNFRPDIFPEMVARRDRVDLRIGRRDGLREVISAATLLLPGFGEVVSNGNDEDVFVGTNFRWNLNGVSLIFPRPVECDTMCLGFGEGFDAGFASSNLWISGAVLTVRSRTGCMSERGDAGDSVSRAGFGFFLMVRGATCGIIAEKNSKVTSSVGVA